MAHLRSVLVVLGAGLVLLTLNVLGTRASTPAQALTADDFNLIAEGFKIFTTETFDGNGRSCGTCHLPEKNFNISPADITDLKTACAGGDSNACDRVDVIFARPSSAGPGNPDLENETLVDQLALFNINEEHELGTGNTPVGPFRASMTVAGVAFTTLNNFVCRDAAHGGLPQTAGCTVGLNPLAPTTVGGFPFPPGITTANGNNTVDDGTRDIELGWAGDGGAGLNPDIFGLVETPANKDCRDAVTAFAADQTNLTKALRVFALGAVRTHNPVTLNRVPGVDFRCPTPHELDALAAFQQWLGRRFELDLFQIAFVKGPNEKGPGPGLAEEGKAIYLDKRASCNACHVNAGANDTQGRVKLGIVEPGFPGGVIPVLDPALLTDPPFASSIPFTIQSFPNPPVGANKNSRTGVDFMRELGVILEDLTSPVQIPRDPGDKVNRGGTVLGFRQGGFNVQSLIEAPRKRGFFHNNEFRTTIEDAASHYFTPQFDLSQGGGAVRNNDFRGAGATGPNTLAALGGTEALNKLGFFLRSLSAVYSLADCERLVSEMIDRTNLGLPTDLPAMHCQFALNDVRHVLEGAQVSPIPYKQVPSQLMDIEARLENATKQPSASGKTKMLQAVVTRLQTIRHSIAMTPQLP